MNVKSKFNNSFYSIIFIISGEPVPAQLDMARFSQNSGNKTLMVILERGNSEIKLDQSKVNFDIKKINVPFNGVDIKRFFLLPKIYLLLNKIIVRKIAIDGVIITTSFDLLLLTRIISRKRKNIIKHQVLDLHKMQLSNSITSRVLRRVEKYLLHKVDTLIVSSMEFVTLYYSKIFNGNVILLENIPSKLVWSNFNKSIKESNSIKIAFIGILRYKKSLIQLIQAVKKAKNNKYKFEILFAGGGNTDELKSELGDNISIEFSGSYEYSRDIKKLYNDIDLIYAVYDSYDLNCQVAMPNKFYEALLSRTPIVVAKNTFVEKEVLRLGIGQSVLTGDITGLIKILESINSEEGWYKNALMNLEKINVDNYYTIYNKAIVSIAGKIMNKIIN